MQTTSALIRLIPLVVMGALLLGGIILMAVNRRHHGSAAILGMVGCVLLLVGLLFGTIVGIFIPSLMRSLGLSMEATIAGWSLISLVFNASGTGLLIWAVVARRTPGWGPTN